MSIKDPTVNQLVEIIEKMEKFLRNDPTNPNKDIWQKTLDNCKNRMTSAIETDHKNRMTSLEKRLLNKGIENITEWMKWAKAQYKITKNEADFTIQSFARDWQDPVTWNFTYEIECFEKVEQLVDWKIRARTRGFGCIDTDLQTA